MFQSLNKVPSPEQFKIELPVTQKIKEIKEARDKEIKQILTGESDKFLLIIGPCSADDVDAVRDYVLRLAKIQEQVKESIFIIPRIYTNKPRTNGIGYKGMLHQPDPKEAENINAGIRAIRSMHIKAISESYMTSADEMLYPENFVYCDDLLSYHAIGARSVENQQHRLAASGIDAPVGMKNPTSGDLTVMFNSIIAAQSSHVFLYRQEEVKTNGNDLAHAILRGSVNKHGENIQNYHYEDLIKAFDLYEKLKLKNPAIILDLNHSNSNKQHLEQPRIAKEILNSMRYNSSIRKTVKGMMVESYIEGGSQKLDENTYGKSITDPCLSFVDSEKLIFDIAESLARL